MASKQEREQAQQAKETAERIRAALGPEKAKKWEASK